MAIFTRRTLLRQALALGGAALTGAGVVLTFAAGTRIRRPLPHIRTARPPHPMAGRVTVATVVAFPFLTLSGPALTLTGTGRAAWPRAAFLRGIRLRARWLCASVRICLTRVATEFLGVGSPAAGSALAARRASSVTTEALTSG
jgi:hypothetical protein